VKRLKTQFKLPSDTKYLSCIYKNIMSILSFVPCLQSCVYSSSQTNKFQKDETENINTVLPDTY